MLKKLEVKSDKVVIEDSVNIEDKVFISDVVDSGFCFCWQAILNNNLEYEYESLSKVRKGLLYFCMNLTRVKPPRRVLLINQVAEPYSRLFLRVDGELHLKTYVLLQFHQTSKDLILTWSSSLATYILFDWVYRIKILGSGTLGGELTINICQ